MSIIKGDLRCTEFDDYAESTLFNRERSFVAIGKVCIYTESLRRQDAAPTCYIAGSPFVGVRHRRIIFEYFPYIRA